MSLEQYRRKRLFQKTPEPEGKVKTEDGNRFVVQKHQASHLHWDFRLEMEGVLKSWAIPKGPPTEPGIKRLAVEVEDHPVEYINFSGIIPEGEYGAGQVKIWDSGEYQLLNKKKDRLEFILDGQRLSGNYILIHTRNQNWILLKRKEEST